MAEVSFEEEKAGLAARPAVAKRGGITAWMVRSHLAASESSASGILLILALVLILLAAGLWYLSQPKPYIPTIDQKLELQKMQTAGPTNPPGR